MLNPSVSYAAPGDVHFINGTLTVNNFTVESVDIRAQDVNSIYPYTFDTVADGSLYSLAVFEGTYDVKLNTPVYIYAPSGGGYIYINQNYYIATDLVVSGDTELDITIPTAPLSGVMKDFAGTAVSGGRIDVYCGSGATFGRVYTDTEGNYQIPALEGPCTLNVFPPSPHQSFSREINVSDITVENFNLDEIVAPTTYSLSGTVTIDNLPGDFTPDIDVYINGTISSNTAADPSTGEYVFEVPAGTYNVYASVNSFNPDGGSNYINYYNSRTCCKNGVISS